jgi:Spy/CpxP family protein refolding chaperone
MVSRRTYGYLVLAAAFAVGVACGGGAAFAYVAQRHAAILRDDGRGPETRRLRILTRKLDLDEGQTQRIRAILIEDRDTMHDLGRNMFERCGEPLREQKGRVEVAIRSVLRPEQQRRYDELLDERHERLWIGPGFFRRRGEDRGP